MMSKRELNEDKIHLSTLLPSNIIAEIEEFKNNNYNNNVNNAEINKENNSSQNQINFNSIKCFSNINTDNVSDMELETTKNDCSNCSNSYRSNTIFSSLFQEENQNQKPKQAGLNHIENKLYYNMPNLINNINNVNNNLNIQAFADKYPLGFNKDNNNNNISFQDINNNQIFNNIINQPANQSRFINYFKMNENESIPDSFENINNNNIINCMNSNLNKIENNNYNYIYNNNINLNQNNYKNYESNQNNVNYFKINNIQCDDYQKANNTKNININNINSINNNIISTKDVINNMPIPFKFLNKNQDYEEFLNYVNGLNIPLIKFLCTKKGISEMESYLSNHKSSNIEILIYLLNKEGLTKLMKHKFGNYFIQEIIRDANYPQIKLILELISNNFVEISESNSGTHTIQTLLEKVNAFELRTIVLKSIENKELEMAFNNNATYVLQKIIGIVPDTERLSTNEIIISNCINLALNSDCIFIVEKFISTITIKENKIRIKNIICENCIQLATSPFGNYLIQYLFQVWKNDDIEQINNIIIENANFLAKQRYSSNVIEKAVDTYDSKIKPRLIRSLSLGGSILEIIKNQYGHYVLNKAVKFMDDELKSEIETILTNQMPGMTKKEKAKSKKFIANLKKNGKIKKLVKK